MRAWTWAAGSRACRRWTYVARVRADRTLDPNGYPDFDIHPEGRRDEYWVIEFLEPLAGNEAAFGLDIRMRQARDAAERARDTGAPVMTGRYRLAQEPRASYGLVIYLPVYGMKRPTTVSERRDALNGFVNVVLRVDDMMAAMLADPVVQGLRMRLHDRGALDRAIEPLSEQTRMYQTPGPFLDDREPGRFEWRARELIDLPVAGRHWGFEFESDPDMAPHLRPLPLLVLLAGLTVSLLLYGILRSLVSRRSEAVALAEVATRELRTQLSFTQQLIEAIPNPVFFKDPQGIYLGCNHAFEEYVGLAREQIVGRRVMDIMPGDLANKSISFDAQLFDKPGSQAYEAHFASREGVPRDVIVNKATFFDPSGAVAGLVGVIVDITQRKQLEAATHESNERLRAVIEAAPLAIVARDRERRVIIWNPSAERMFGWKESEVLGTVASIVPEPLREETERLRLRARAGETIWIEETQRMARDGRLLDVSLTMSPLHGADGSVEGTMVMIADISRRKQAEAALRQSEAQLRLAMEAAQLGMWYWECDTDRFDYSEGLGTLFGRPRDAAPVDYRVLQEAMHAEDRELFQATFRHALRQGSDFMLDYRVVWPDGSVHWVANRGQVHRGSDGRAQRVIGVAMDITERKLAEQRIAHMAHHDALTGLPNRVLLRDRIGQAIAHAHRAGRQIAVLFIDLDRFKTINDSLGHQFGDRLLQSVASRILVCVREGDTVARVGGDEFVIVIPGIDQASDASVVATKILEVLGHAFHLHGNDVHVAGSIGISLYPSDGTDAETLMRHADTAMYHAKDSGRANFQFFTEHMNVAAQQRLSLENSLRRAAERSEFELHFQPVFDLGDRSVAAFEALLRWNMPERGMVSPAEFITAAEESGLIVPVGEWVLREALRQARTWQAFGRPVRVAVNVSARQLARQNFVERLRRIIEEVAIEPGLIELEVTESVIIEGAGEARAALDQIAALGVGIAIDDFGTGYSGLAYLKRLPIDTVKIDQSFVSGLTQNRDDAAIVTAIVAMSRSLGLEVVAEGVETEHQLRELERLGCRLAQGYLLARPMSAAATREFLERARAGVS
ncbi:MAG TPA: EAL domain-containing protein [Usitatibacter sp.]|nr:EAL domain-containing protein [Usitatibacter sp.]